MEPCIVLLLTPTELEMIQASINQLTPTQIKILERPLQSFAYKVDLALQAFKDAIEERGYVPPPRPA